MIDIRSLADRLHLEAVDQMVSLGATGASGFTNLRSNLENSMIPEIIRKGAQPHTIRVEVTILDRLTPIKSNARVRLLADAFDDPEDEAVVFRVAQYV